MIDVIINFLLEDESEEGIDSSARKEVYFASDSRWRAEIDNRMLSIWWNDKNVGEVKFPTMNSALGYMDWVLPRIAKLDHSFPFLPEKYKDVWDWHDAHAHTLDESVEDPLEDNFKDLYVPEPVTLNDIKKAEPEDFDPKEIYFTELQQFLDQNNFEHEKVSPAHEKWVKEFPEKVCVVDHITPYGLPHYWTILIYDANSRHVMYQEQFRHETKLVIFLQTLLKA